MNKLIAVACATLAYTGTAGALEVDPLVPPEINFGGRALGTIVGTETSETDAITLDDNAADELDFSDSSLLFRFNKYLFSGPPAYGFALFGLRRPDNAVALKDEVFFHELNVGVGGRQYELKLGRSRLRNSLLVFPTIRDDDLLEFTHVPNASSYADTDVYEIFGGSADLQWWPSQRVMTNAALTARTETDVVGNVTDDSNFNGYNVGIAYGLPQALKFDRGVRFAGLTLDSQTVDELGDKRLNAVLAGLIYTLNSNPEADWVLEAQAIGTDGVDGVTSLATKAERSRAKRTSVVAGIRFNKRPYLQTRWQAALTLAWKDYRGFDDAQALAIAPSFLYRLGSGVDWVTQYIYTSNGDGLAQAIGVEDEHRFYTGLSFSFGFTLNESVAERGSILSIEHNMGSSFGPGSVGGGDS